VVHASRLKRIEELEVELIETKQTIVTNELLPVENENLRAEIRRLQTTIERSATDLQLKTRALNRAIDEIQQLKLHARNATEVRVSEMLSDDVHRAKQMYTPSFLSVCLCDCSCSICFVCQAEVLL